ncbi:hypothetical protein A9P82_08850 [Arachidicoccus ginsenosidimutans]|uniref:helix-turn-helix domain-containing protein n=1 Tax=Arachidicoccus sp. BS20 TaxID=1850526 RepID=UPI0007F108C5|nr:AraC family transcriptional regulator [Arachidicoccus sp. BS20]ANI89391.1 hypothetical protein A9P82_08850 [Arachidicoccus sp. BS20]
MEIDFTQIVKLFDKNLKEIPIMKGFPEGKDYDKYKINGAKRFHAQIEMEDRKKKIRKNILLFQCIEIGDMTIWVSDYLIYVPMYIQCIADSESLELHTTLLGETQYRLKGFDWRRTKAGQYNLIYLPAIENEVNFRGFLKTFDLHVSKELLYRMSEEFPQLQPLVDSIRIGEINSLYEEFADIPLKAMYQIVILAMTIQSGDAQNTEAKTTAMNALRALVGAKGKESRKYRYNYEEVKTLHTISERLTALMNKQDALTSLLKEYRQKNKLTGDKIWEGFKLIFECSPKHYLLSKRMEKGKSLLEQGFLLQDICEQTGYSKVSHFETAFLKFYGYPVKDKRPQKS